MRDWYSGVDSVEVAGPPCLFAWLRSCPRKIGHLWSNTRLYSSTIATFQCFPIFPSFPFFWKTMALHHLISVHQKSLRCFNWNCQVAWALSLLHGQRPQGEKGFHPCKKKLTPNRKHLQCQKGAVYVACGGKATTSSTRDYNPLTALATKMAWPPRSWVISLPSLAHAMWHVMPMPLSNWAKRRDLAMVKGW